MVRLRLASGRDAHIALRTGGDPTMRMSSEVRAATLPTYGGPTEFTPSEEAQTAHTAGTQLPGDITINPIPSNWGRISWNGSVLTVS